MMPVKEENTVIPDVIKPVSEIKTDIMESKPKTKWFDRGRGNDLPFPLFFTRLNYKY